MIYFSPICRTWRGSKAYLRPKLKKSAKPLRRLWLALRSSIISAIAFEIFIYFSFGFSDFDFAPLFLFSELWLYYWKRCSPQSKFEFIYLFFDFESKLDLGRLFSYIWQWEKTLILILILIFCVQRKSVIRITTGSQALDELLGGNLFTACIIVFVWKNFSVIWFVCKIWKRWDWNSGDYRSFWGISVRFRLWITVVPIETWKALICIYTTFEFLYCAISPFRSGKTQLAHTLCVSTQVPFSTIMCYWP